MSDRIGYVFSSAALFNHVFYSDFYITNSLCFRGKCGCHQHIDTSLMLTFLANRYISATLGESETSCDTTLMHHHLVYVTNLLANGSLCTHLAFLKLRDRSFTVVFPATRWVLSPKLSLPSFLFRSLTTPGKYLSSVAERSAVWCWAGDHNNYSGSHSENVADFLLKYHFHLFKIT